MLPPSGEVGRGLTPALLDAAFPFHLVLDTDLRIVQSGSSVQRLSASSLLGQHLRDVYEIVTPKCHITFDAVAEQSRALFLLRSKTTADLVLRGQMLHDDAAGSLVFVGSPWVTDTSLFASLGLTLDDFAVSDAVVDYLLLLQHQATSLATTRQLAERLRESAEQLTHQAYHDALTGLPNRSMLLRQLHDALASVDGSDGDDADRPAASGARSVAVLMLDLDGFKAVNDSYGHSSGDAVLEVVAQRLRSVVRDGDVVARFGGDEFALMLPGASAELGEPSDVATSIAERVHAVLEEPVALPLCPTIVVPLMASVGIAYSTSVETAEELLRNADLAMYSAKANGKARHERYVPSMHARSVSRLDLTNQLRRAVDNGELRLMYQPVLRLDGNRFAGAEALLRWQHPTRGLIGPDTFLEMAEETGLIVPIGAWVLDEACAELRRWQAAHDGPLPLGVAVNLSGRQFGPGLVAEVEATLRRHQIDPSSLTLEITEGLITGEGPGAQETVRGLKRLGVWLAIDDFGTGHSSLGRLRDYEFDELKIDRQFVSDLDAGGTSLVAAQIAMAHGLGLTVVAEGVETQAQLDYLRSQRCGQIQGYFVARPLPPEEIRQLLAAQAQWIEPQSAAPANESVVAQHQLV